MVPFPPYLSGGGIDSDLAMGHLLYTLGNQVVPTMCEVFNQSATKVFSEPSNVNEVFATSTSKPGDNRQCSL